MFILWIFKGVGLETRTCRSFEKLCRDEFDHHMLDETCDETLRVAPVVAAKLPQTAVMARAVD